MVKMRNFYNKGNVNIIRYFDHFSLTIFKNKDSSFLFSLPDIVYEGACDSKAEILSVMFKEY